ncbi:MAG TPA: glucose 1-dehydrogenase [Candidatus Binataceae bacterium]|jgi:NAD(P)-dependent dehydrogenase (short-subunit alcohol dehydrogenase family)|nr:glucose 1-dehydrogenase [Candidatus Binataceae bacterium]
MLLKGKIALITGAGAGIGRAAALAFAREGARLVVADIVAADETAAMVRAAAGDVLAIKCDVSSSAEVEALIGKAVSTYGRIDSAFNNAGIESRVSNTADITEAEFDRQIAVNLKGVWLCLKYELPQMVKQGVGAIVNTSSGAGIAGAQGWSAYSAAKHGVVGLTRCAALEYARAGIRVNALCPGPIDSPMGKRIAAENPGYKDLLIAHTPNGRLGRPEEVAEAAVWLCSDAASLVNGSILPVDGGTVAG